jgi:hypothetical protein
MVASTAAIIADGSVWSTANANATAANYLI